MLCARCMLVIAIGRHSLPYVAYIAPRGPTDLSHFRLLPMRLEGSVCGAATTSVVDATLGIRIRSSTSFLGTNVSRNVAVRNNRSLIDIAAQRAYTDCVRITDILKYDSAPRRLAKKPSSAPSNKVIVSGGVLLAVSVFGEDWGRGCLCKQKSDRCGATTGLN